MRLETAPEGTCEIMRVTNGPIQTNTYFVVSEGEAVVIDPAWEGERLVEAFRARYPGAALKAVLCTHGHADHVGGVAGVRRALPGIAYLLPEADLGIPAANIAEQRAWGIDTPDPGAPTRVLSEGDAIACGSVTLQAVATPGHTPGGMVYFAATRSGDVAFAGDTLFPGGHGRTDLTGGDEEAILASLGKLARMLPPDTVCYIGHGEATTIRKELATNPFMGAHPW